MDQPQASAGHSDAALRILTVLRACAVLAIVVALVQDVALGRTVPQRQPAASRTAAGSRAPRVGHRDQTLVPRMTARGARDGTDRSSHVLTLASGIPAAQTQFGTVAVFAAVGAAAGLLAAGLGAWIIQRRRRSRDVGAAAQSCTRPSAPLGMAMPAVQEGVKDGVGGGMWAGLGSGGAVGEAAGAEDRNAEGSEVARLECELEEARRQIADGLVERERFLSNVSHEIKTPIAVLMIEAPQTINRRDCSESTLRFVETVEVEMTRLGKLVESLLLLTRVQSGRGPATLKCYSLNDMVIDSIESCTPIARQHDVTLRPTLLELDATVDAGVVGDPDLLRTLLENLLRNSIRFSPPGSTIDATASVEGESARITVRDQGPCIPAERLKTIFNRFSSARESQQQGRGHVLGLAIAKGIAELHGGTIEVFNLDGNGCEFVVRLRLAHPVAE